MENIETVEVDGVKYNAVRASAINQKKLMNLIAARISLNSAATQTETIDKNMIYGLLLSLTESEFDEVSRIVLHKTLKHNGDSLVTIDDFQDKIHSYFYLVAELIVINLKDFFTWLDAENAKQRLANQGKENL